MFTPKDNHKPTNIIPHPTPPPNASTRDFIGKLIILVKFIKRWQNEFYGYSGTKQIVPTKTWHFKFPVRKHYSPDSDKVP